MHLVYLVMLYVPIRLFYEPYYNSVKEICGGMGSCL